jgi:threonine synthase
MTGTKAISLSDPRNSLSKTCLRCRNCARKFGIVPLVCCPECSGPLDAHVRHTAAPAWIKQKNLKHKDFRDSFPLPDAARSFPVTLGEGGTPLLKCGRLGQALGISRLYVKNEAMNPTASWKDRPISLAVNCAVGFGYKVVAVYSCGNAGSAAAAYAAKAGSRCVVLAMPTISRKMVRLIDAYGGIVVLLDLSPHEVWIEGRAGTALEYARTTLGWFPLNMVRNPPAWSPFYIEGYKSLAYELVQELQFVPDWVVVPAGSGEGLFGIWKGFCELRELKQISRLPKMVGVQASGAAPLVNAFASGLGGVAALHQARTIASGIELMISNDSALGAIRESGGCALDVTEKQIRTFGHLLATLEGLNASPEGAAAVAGALKLQRQGRLGIRDTVVCVCTAGGLKYPQYHVPSLTQVSSEMQSQLGRFCRHLRDDQNLAASISARRTSGINKV